MNTKGKKTFASQIFHLVTNTRNIWNSHVCAIATTHSEEKKRFRWCKQNDQWAMEKDRTKPNRNKPNRFSMCFSISDPFVSLFSIQPLCGFREMTLCRSVFSIFCFQVFGPPHWLDVHSTLFMCLSVKWNETENYVKKTQRPSLDPLRCSTRAEYSHGCMCILGSCERMKKREKTKKERKNEATHHIFK